MQSEERLKAILEENGLGEYYPNMVAARNAHWVGPVTIDTLLDNGINSR